jgi:membrane-associated phospholipid phosphatase
LTVAPALDASLHYLAGFGDVNALAPATLVILIMLFAMGRFRLGVIWAASFGACVLATFGLKAWLGGFELSIFSLHLVADEFPSGHTSTATAFYGTLALATWRSSAGGWCGHVAKSLSLLVAGFALAIVISVRLLGWHHALDIGFGLLLGGVCVFAVDGALRRQQIPLQLMPALLLPALLVAVLLHGERMISTASLKAAFAAYIV